VSYLFFLDESGQDHRESPYEVRAAAAIHDSRIWSLICAIEAAELDIFGVRYSQPGGPGSPGRELKAKRLLNKKTFRLAAQMPEFNHSASVSCALSARRYG
jgi:hypothetical protein